MVHRRHQDRVRDPLAGREREEVPGLEGGQQDAAAAGLDHREQDRDQAGHVGRGHRQQRAVARRKLHREPIVQDRVDDVQMGQQRPFRPAGGAGGVEDDRDVLLPGLVPGRRRRGALDQAFERQ